MAVGKVSRFIIHQVRRIEMTSQEDNQHILLEDPSAVLATSIISQKIISLDHPSIDLDLSLSKRDRSSSSEV